MNWQRLSARVVPGYQVASGRNGDRRFPGGTLGMQLAHFRERGLDLSVFHHGTLNVSIAPLRYRVVQPRLTFRAVKWHPTEPAEDFSFFDVRLIRNGTLPVNGLIYYPHPDTKPMHFQKPDVLELLLPFVSDVNYDAEIRLEIPVEQMVVEGKIS